MGKIFIITGAFLILVGVSLILLEKTGLFRFLGNLPGDIKIERDGFSFYFPLVTCILISILFSLVNWLFRK